MVALSDKTNHLLHRSYCTKQIFPNPGIIVEIELVKTVDTYTMFVFSVHAHEVGNEYTKGAISRGLVLLAVSDHI